MFSSHDVKQRLDIKPTSGSLRFIIQHEGIQNGGAEVVSSVKYAVRRGNLYDWVGDSTPEGEFVKMIAGHKSKLSLVI